MINNIGDTIRVKATFRDVDDNVADPSTIALAVQFPDSSEIEYTYAEATITKESVGVYYKDISITMSGVHRYRFTSTGIPALMEEDDFAVASNTF